jgi:hypothetical protein
MKDKELEIQVATVVENLFNEKEEADIRKKTEEALQKSAASISELTSALETKNSEVMVFEAQASEKDATIQQLTSELEAAKVELESANVKLADSEKALNDIVKERAAEKRMVEIEDAGVARSDRDSQMTKVKEMTDEEFASYKDELVSIREAVVKELEEARKAQAGVDAKAEEETAKKAEEDASKKELAEKEAADKEAADKEAADKVLESNEKDVVAPVQITPGQAAMASLNMEYLPNKDIMAKYADLGKAMANVWKKSEK